jgi:hypothetical protein
MLRHFLEIGVQIDIGDEDYIRDEVLRIIFCSCVTLDFGWGQQRSLWVSSEEEMHMLPSFCEGVPSDMSPSEWCLVLFPTLPAELSQDRGERGSNGEREMLRHFLENGVHTEKGKC